MKQNNSAENTGQSFDEWLDAVDDKGNPTGKIIDRRTAHAQGIRHRTAHVWVLRHNAQTEKMEILLQLRSKTKDSFPKSYVSYRKPRAVSTEQRERARQMVIERNREK